MAGEEFGKLKLKEQKHRILEMERVLKELDIPEAYPNSYRDKDYKDKID